MSMPYLSLWNPWAALVAHGKKRIETRHWPTDYRGDVAIFATRAWNGECQRMVCEDVFAEALEPHYGTGHADDGKWLDELKRTLPFGAVVAVAELIDCRPTVTPHQGDLEVCSVFDVYPTLDTPQERAFGNYEPGRFGLVLANVCALLVPVPMRGRQGKLVALDADVEAQVLEQVIKAGGAGPEYIGGVR